MASCPNCQHALTIQGNRLHCTQTACDFDIRYRCPFCNHAFESDTGACPECQQCLDTDRLLNMIQYDLVLDTENTCKTCQSITLHPRISPNARRCFKYPNCVGQMSLFETKPKDTLVFLDFETTGLDMNHDDIIEIGALKLDTNGHLNHFQTFVHTQTSISETITKLTGITTSMMIGAPSPKSVFQSFCEFVGTSTLVVHNADFDIPWLLIMNQVHGAKLHTNQFVCTLDWAKKNQEPRCSLGVLAKKYGIVNSNAHRALSDAIATHALYFCFDNLSKAPRPVQSLNHYTALAERIATRRMAETVTA